MNTDRHTAHLIATRHITGTRVPAGEPPKPGQPLRLGTLQPPRRGRRITITVHREHRAFDPACQVVITNVTRSPHGHAATLQDGGLGQLGHDTIDSYARAWLRDRDQAWLARRCPAHLNPPSTLNAVDEALDVLDDAAVLARWQDRWADRAVWVVEWETVDDETLWLADGGGVRYRRLPSGRQEVVQGDDDSRLEDRGLTTRTDRALVDAGSYVDPDGLDPAWARDAARRHGESVDPRLRARRLAGGLR